MVAAGVRAVVGAQRALVKDVQSRYQGRAANCFRRSRPGCIADVVARDLPYYTPEISDESLAGLIRFSQATGLLKGSSTREQMVATQFNRYLTG